MYERFTDRARKVMQLANQEAKRFNHEYIGTEHILLGLVREGEGVAVGEAQDRVSGDVIPGEQRRALAAHREGHGVRTGIGGVGKFEDHPKEFAAVLEGDRARVAQRFVDLVEPRVRKERIHELGSGLHRSRGR